MSRVPAHTAGARGGGGGAKAQVNLSDCTTPRSAAGEPTGGWGTLGATLPMLEGRFSISEGQRL